MSETMLRGAEMPSDEVLRKTPDVETCAMQDFLQDVEALVCAKRAGQYGSPTGMFDDVAASMNRRLQAMGLMQPEAKLTADHAILLMMDLKLTRLVKNPGCDDSLRDIAGYAACLAAVRAERRQ